MHGPLQRLPALEQPACPSLAVPAEELFVAFAPGARHACYIYCHTEGEKSYLFSVFDGIGNAARSGNNDVEDT